MIALKHAWTPFEKFRNLEKLIKSLVRVRVRVRDKITFISPSYRCERTAVVTSI